MPIDKNMDTEDGDNHEYVDSDSRDNEENDEEEFREEGVKVVYNKKEKMNNPILHN